MTNRIHNRMARATVGAALIALVGACSDAPSSPVPYPPTPLFPEQAASRVADIPILDAALPLPMAGEFVRRRDVRTRDGAHFIVESLVDGSGLPREVRVTQNGQPIARLSNEWRSTAGGVELGQQRLVRFIGGRASAVFDSRDRGGVSSLAHGSIVLPLKSAAFLRSAPSDAVHSVRLLSVEGEYDVDGGPCDAEAAAVEEAIDDWILSVLATGAGIVAANPVVTWTAYAYQVRMYRNVVRKEAALDQCVEAAGRPE